MKKDKGIFFSSKYTQSMITNFSWGYEEHIYKEYSKKIQRKRHFECFTIPTVLRMMMMMIKEKGWFFTRISSNLDLVIGWLEGWCDLVGRREADNACGCFVVILIFRPNKIDDPLLISPYSPKHLGMGWLHRPSACKFYNVHIWWGSGNFGNLEFL